MRVLEREIAQNIKRKIAHKEWAVKESRRRIFRLQDTPEKRAVRECATSGYCEVTNRGGVVIFRHRGMEIASNDGLRTFWVLATAERVYGSAVQVMRTRARQKQLSQRWWSNPLHCARKSGCMERLEYGMNKDGVKSWI